MEGEGLVFIVYRLPLQTCRLLAISIFHDFLIFMFSDAIASMPFSFFWAIIFFFMLITLGLDRLEDIHIGENIALQLVTDGVFENR